MTTQSIDVKWATNMAFQANVFGHELILDLEETAGGTNMGPKPKPLLLVALGGVAGPFSGWKLVVGSWMFGVFN